MPAVVSATTVAALAFTGLMPGHALRDAIGIWHGAVIVLRRARRFVVLRAGLSRRGHVGVVVHVVGMAVVAFLVASFSEVAVVLLAGTRHVAAVVVARIEVLALGGRALTKVFGATLALETAATATAASAATAAARAAFALTLVATLPGRLLSGLLLVLGLFAHAR